MSRVIEFKKIKLTRIIDKVENMGYIITDGYENQLFLEENVEEMNEVKALEAIEKDFPNWYYEEVLGYGFWYENKYFEVDDLGNIIGIKEDAKKEKD